MSRRARDEVEEPSARVRTCGAVVCGLLLPKFVEEAKARYFRTKETTAYVGSVALASPVLGSLNSRRWVASRQFER